MPSLGRGRRRRNALSYQERREQERAAQRASWQKQKDQVAARYS